MLEIVALLFAGLGVVVSALATILAVKSGNATRNLTREIHDRQEASTRELHKAERLLSQRQVFLQIWPTISQMPDLRAAEPSPREVVDNVNALELVAVCMEGELVDTDIIKRTFAPRYIEMYERIQGLPVIPRLSRSGADLLRENPAAGRLYKSLVDEQQNAGKLLGIDASAALPPATSR